MEDVARIVGEHAGPSELRAMLELRRSEVANTIEKEAHRLRRIETRIAQLDADSALEQPDVLLRPEPARLLLAARVTQGSEGAQARGDSRLRQIDVERGLVVPSATVVDRSPNGECCLTPIDHGFDAVRALGEFVGA